MNNNNSALVTANSSDDKNDANNVNDREFTRTADMAARAITRTQRFVKTHYRGLLATAGAATALGILYAIRKNHDDDNTVDDADNVEYEFESDDTAEVVNAPMSNNTL